ncbi:hypothetical protein [Methylotuvimicrobium sp.]|uniref:hypothetical protein n=1 Tax=Methylotuvimicrobium sp. TaxID=2822413 RepID=UPI003D65A9E9
MSTVTGSVNLKTGPAKVEMKLRQRSAFAVQHIMAAARFSRMCGEIESAYEDQPLGNFFDTQIGAVSATVMLATASIESNINEYLCEPEQVFPNLSGESPHSLVRLLEQKSILEKYQAVLSFRGVAEYPAGESPYQDVDALIKLRNALVHFKPEWHDEQELHRKIEGRLKGRFEINPAIGGNGVFFPQQCMSYGCTRWAVNTSLTFMKDFSKRSGLPYRFEKFSSHINPEVA